MHLFLFFPKRFALICLVGTLAACADNPRAVMLPLEYPDGTFVRTTKGEPAMAGYQTYGSSTHARATALYEQARPASCATCARLGAVVTEPSLLRQVTGVIGTAAYGTGAVMTGIGVMEYGDAAQEGKLGTRVVQNTTGAHKGHHSYQPQKPWPQKPPKNPWPPKHNYHSGGNSYSGSGVYDSGNSYSGSGVYDSGNSYSSSGVYNSGNSYSSSGVYNSGNSYSR